MGAVFTWSCRGVFLHCLLLGRCCFVCSSSWPCAVALVPSFRQGWGAPQSGGRGRVGPALFVQAVAHPHGQEEVRLHGCAGGLGAFTRCSRQTSSCGVSCFRANGALKSRSCSSYNTSSKRARTLRLGLVTCVAVESGAVGGGGCSVGKLVQAGCCMHIAGRVAGRVAAGED